MNILDLFYHNFNVTLGKGVVHNCLLVMIEASRKIRDNKVVFAAVFKDLPKAFDCIPHTLLS